MHEIALRLLREARGEAMADFRDGQWEAIDGLVTHRRRMLLVQRTGWGKSMVYFIATRLLRDRGAGPALIVSPLLALMRDQLAAAARIGIQAATVNSANRDDWPRIEQSLSRDEIDILLISPERLSHDGFVEACLKPILDRVALLVVDEAHCISDWGHDFRPDYRRLPRLLALLPADAAILATTATANGRVAADIAAQLGGGLEVRRGPLTRDSLKLQAIPLPGQAERMAWLAEHLPKLPGTGIIYCLTIRDCEKLALWLRRRGFAVEAYHGRSPDRAGLERRLLDNEVKALVATNALGMGFDKADLGFVVHFQAPQSVVHYYQQAGRAGRTDREAFAILLSGREDDEVNRFFIDEALAPLRHAGEILAVLEKQAGGMTAEQIEAEIYLHRRQIERALKLLALDQPPPVTRRGMLWQRTKAGMNLDRRHVAELTDLRRREWAQMRDYLSSRKCLMQYLARALGDETAAPCGGCAVCRGKPLLPRTVPRRLIAEAEHFLKAGKAEWAATPYRREEVLPPQPLAALKRKPPVFADEPEETPSGSRLASLFRRLLGRR